MLTVAGLWLPQRIFERVSAEDCGFHQGPCWLVEGWSDGKGHAKMRWRGRQTFVHRVTYHLFHGTPVFTLDNIDHLCRSRACCHPLHLEDVPAKVNTQRGLGVHHQFKQPEAYRHAA